MDALQTECRLTHRFASHLCGLCKPDAAIFEHVERTTGVPPSQILFFDDLAENVDAAKSRGWRGYVIDSRRAEALDRLDPASIPAADRAAKLPAGVVAVFGEHRWRAPAPVQTVAISPDDTLVASAGDLGVIAPGVLGSALPSSQR